MSAEQSYPPLLIRASAGTGKTYDLSSRYISLVLASELPERILATTFTKKAASEIHERVLNRLAEAVDQSLKLNELSASTLENGKLKQQAALDALRSLVRQQHRLRISTLDSFFLTLVSSFAFELGLPIPWRLADPKEEVAINREAVRRLCANEQHSIVATLASIGNFRGSSIQARMENMLSNIMTYFRNSDPNAWKSFKVDAPTISHEQIAELSSTLAKINLPLTKKGVESAHFVKARNELICNLASRNWEQLLGKGFCNSLISGSHSYQKVPLSVELIDAVSPIISMASLQLISETTKRTSAIFSLLEKLEKEIQQVKRGLGLITYDDVKSLLSEASLSARLEELYFRLDSQIHHLLLDEFQDTSQREWQVIEPIVDEIVSKAESEYSFFCVGDVKQAIYGWRGGVAKIFDQLQERWPQIIDKQKSESRRSSRNVIEFVNLVFGSLVGNSDEDTLAFKNWSRGFKRHSTFYQERLGFVEAEWVPDNHDIWESVVNKVEEISFNSSIDVGVLCRTRSQLARILWGLKRRGIEASGEGGTAIYDTPIVVAFCELLTLIDHPTNSLSHFVVKNSNFAEILQLPSLNVEALGKWCTRQRSDIWKLGLGSWSANLFRALESELSLRERERLDQVLNILFAKQDKFPARLMEVAEDIRATKVEELSESRVRVMTIHSAKGLEFDAVVFPAVGMLAEIRPENVLAEPSEQGGSFNRIIAYPNALIRSLEPEFAKMYSVDRVQKIEEGLSVLYVALTRAKSSMHILLPEGSSSKSASYAQVISTNLTDWKDWSVPFKMGEPSHSADLSESSELGESQSESIRAKHQQIKTTKQVVRGLPVLSPSTLKRPVVFKAVDLLSLSSGDFEFGRLVHLFFEDLEWIENLEATRRAFREMRGSSNLVESVLGRIEIYLQYENISKLFDRSAYLSGYDRVDVFTERSFVVHVDQQLVSGSFDRLLLCYLDGQLKQIELVDFKSDRITTKEQLELATKRYWLQLKAYLEALAVMYGNIGDLSIVGKLVFLECGEIITYGS